MVQSLFRDLFCQEYLRVWFRALYFSSSTLTIYLMASPTVQFVCSQMTVFCIDMLLTRTTSTGSKCILTELPSWRSPGWWNSTSVNVLQWGLCTDRLNWGRRTSLGWWDDTVLQSQDSKFEPWRSEAKHATFWSRRLPTRQRGRSKIDPPMYILHGQVLCITDTTKYIGLTITSDLK